jgi:uncharacterized protein YdhG (YjbR/CyaY superfamily)
MTVIDEYFENIEPSVRAELERIRAVVHQVAPSSEEVITYGMPGFKYHKKYLVGFNARRDHLGLYPTSGPIEVLQPKLAGYSLSKGTIRFTLSNPLPEVLIKEILQIRMATIDQP